MAAKFSVDRRENLRNNSGDEIDITYFSDGTCHAFFTQEGSKKSQYINYAMLQMLKTALRPMKLGVR